MKKISFIITRRTAGDFVKTEWFPFEEVEGNWNFNLGAPSACPLDQGDVCIAPLKKNKRGEVTIDITQVEKIFGMSQVDISFNMLKGAILNRLWGSAVIKNNIEDFRGTKEQRKELELLSLNIK